jgi:hypothetical protein
MNTASAESACWLIWEQSAQQVLNMQQELQLHIGFCKEYGMEVKDIEDQEEDQGEWTFSSMEAIEAARTDRP